ncbi:MAG: PSD1 domain-containing protein, partial [Candidatus Omnitrophica bacterium]|nr:PSD1 domain-containing protein [Candidatus Omnitrophota bacterium]
MTKRISLLTVISTLALLISLPTVSAQDSKKIDFESQIQPIFENRCLKCHGPEKQKSGFRLDHKEPAMLGGDYGKAILPGKGEESPLYRAIAGLDPDLQMPPSGDPVPKEEAELIKRWIDEGADWPEGEKEVEIPNSDHWAFQPIKNPEVPQVKNADWVRNPIDSFVLNNLEAKGVEPSRPADRWTLIRRLSLDLTGLPPTPEEVLAFVNDTDPNAYEKLVDRLLDSPHYGERMARHWLDLARYADSDGYEKDLPRPNAWRYREWVIKAFNRDLPYDRFTIQQLAGDLLPDGGTPAKVATGFHRNTLTNREGGIDPEEDRVKQNVDRINTTGTVFLGLTIGCAQCHTHKYDPITQREYYQMYSFFDHAVEKDIPAVLPWQQRDYETRLAKWEKERNDIEGEIAEYRPTLAEKLPAWEKEQDVADVHWELLRPTSMASIGGATFEILDDGSIFVGGENPTADEYILVAPLGLSGVTGLRLEAITDSRLPRNGPGRARHGNFMLTEIEAKVRKKSNPKMDEPLKFVTASADYEQEGYEVDDAIDGKESTGWSIDAWRDPSLNVDRQGVFVAEKEVGFEEGSILQIRLDFSYGNNHGLGRFRLFAASGPREHLEIPPDIPAILATAVENRTEEQTDRLLDYFGTIEPESKKLLDKLAKHDEGKPNPPDTKAQTLVANPEPPTTHIHTRGDFLRPGDPVQPTTLAVLQPFEPRQEPEKKQPDRLDLANWIVARDNPLTSRVAVNRWWMHLFGRGIVNTPEDFGTRGEKPSHPELLDWLATWYMDNGWSTKDLIRLVVTSNTYRQSSETR